jgi:hypothetical protein
MHNHSKRRYHLRVVTFFSFHMVHMLKRFQYFLSKLIQRGHTVNKAILQHYVLSLHWVDIILPQYRPLKYAIIHIFLLSHNDLIAGCSFIPYLCTVLFHAVSKSIGPSGKLNKYSSSTFRPLFAKYNLSKSCRQPCMTWNLQYRCCVFLKTIGIAIFIVGSSSAINIITHID